MTKEKLEFKLDSKIVSKLKELQNTAGGTVQGFVKNKGKTICLGVWGWDIIAGGDHKDGPKALQFA
ncbi:hypothetical protein HRM2_p00040 (plasmid) [Desulforapulum autotrophicum HRM2]|uniref:Uncharacterized protein n=1 Tax=Desulforapulum autotrophicum (strain ATCC 43914 / DSM 3382 / VKM B-1955 / HRM2) TaxID=177437 RepID=C0QMK4_DESAH|nr:hypothetical protein [Desulforapulum autotrophicum]ACN17998.1 hypothetical protein HRM2_p00040 [Desulforapulum autotrophicum HRM2]